MEKSNPKGAPGNIKTVILSTDMVSPTDQNDFWHEVTRPIFEVTLASQGSSQLKGTIHSHTLGNIIIGGTWFNHQKYHRNSFIIRQSGLDDYILQYVTAGTLVGDCDGVSIEASAGDICIFDLSRPYINDSSSGSRLTVVIPRERITRIIGTTSLHGTVLKANDPVTHLLGGFIHHIATSVTTLNAADLPDLEDSIISFIAACISRIPVHDLLHRPQATPVLKQRAIEFIDANMSNPDLTPELLADRLRISRAHLYRAFSNDGGVSAFIRERRLQNAFQQLTGNRAHLQSISETASLLGFSNIGQFSRAFKQRFSLSPSQARSDIKSPPNLSMTDRNLQHHFLKQAQIFQQTDKDQN